MASASSLLSDPRASHYWDPANLAGRAFAPVVGTGSAAWDVWMLFDRSATWGDAPPEPAWWEHQLGGLPEERMLDPERFARRALELGR